MKANRITAFALCLTILLSYALPNSVYAEDNAYTVDIQNATYYVDNFDGDTLPDTAGNAKAEIVIDDSDNVRVLAISGEGEVRYAIPGNTVLWDGTSVSTEFSGDGSEENPFLIKSGADLKLLQESVNGGNSYQGKYFKLLNNIDLSNHEWEPIGNGTYPFSGSFDGNYNKVINISRHELYSTNKFIGFFGKVTGNISNFGVENVEYIIENSASNAVSSAGGLVGNFKGTIDNCYARNVKIGNTSESKSIDTTGGLAGTVLSGSTIQNSYVVDFTYQAEFVTSSDKIGCLGGYLRSSDDIISVYNCYVAGKFVPDSKLLNYWALSAVERTANIKSGNNYCAHGVETYKTNMTQVEPKYAAVTSEKLGKLATDLGDGFIEDVSTLVNHGYPYHKKESSNIPDEVTVKFDINFDTSDEVGIKLINVDGDTCVDETVSNSFGEGWHSVAIDVNNGKYTVSVDNKPIKQENLLAEAGHSEIVFTQKDTMTCKIDNIFVNKDYEETLTKVADDLMKIFMEENDLSNITQDINLFAGFNGYKLKWETSNDKVIRENGEVIRRAISIPVTLTVCYDGISTAGVVKPTATVTFDVMVAANNEVTDEEKVHDVIDYYLTDDILTDEELNAVTGNLKPLPSEYEGVSISWSSGKPDVISDDGTVTLPETDNLDEAVPFTATVSLNDASKEVSFNLTVLAPLSDETKLIRAMDGLGYNRITVEDINSITKNITLPKQGMYNSTITWDSNNKSVISDDGTVTRGNKDTFVELTATFEINSAVKTKTYFFNVLMSEADCIKEDMDVVGIPAEATESFTLPLKGAIHSSLISWVSDNACIEIENGIAKVIRPANNENSQDVVLTATAVYGETKLEREYTVTVVKSESDTVLVNRVYDSITWESLSAEDINSVTENLPLRKEYDSGVNVSWSSDPVDVITEDGVVLRPMPSDGDKNVRLSADISKNNVSRIKEFNLTVKAFLSDEEAIKKAAQELVFSELSSSPVDCVEEDISLPTDWRYGTSIEWSSSDETVITVSAEDAKGYIHTPEFGTENKSVKLSAKISLGELTKTKEFLVTLAEPDAEKEIFFLDMEKYEIGELTKRDNITLNKAYVGTSIVEDPKNAENKVMRLYKDSTYQPMSQKGTQIATIGEKTGLFEVSLRMLVEKLADRNFCIFGVFGTGEEIKVNVVRKDDGVTVAGVLIPYNEWADIKIEFNTYEKVYRVFVNGEFIKEYDFSYKVTKAASKANFARFYFDFVYNSAVGEHIVYIDDMKFIKKISPKASLSEAAELFESKFLAAQDIKAIRGDLFIPEISLIETSVETVSSDTDYVTDDGKVTVPTDEDKNIAFSAIFKNDYGSFRTKVFDLVLKANGSDDGMTDQERDLIYAMEDVNEVAEYIYQNHTANRITSDLKLIESGARGSVLTYSSSDARYITDDGKVTRPSDTDKEVILTVTATRNEAVEKREIAFTVLKAQKTNESKVTSSGGGGGGVSRVVVGSGITVTPSDNSDGAAVTKSVFPDITNHWAREYIETLYKEGVVSGKKDGNFGPDENITREEFITLLVKAMGIELVQRRNKFADVKDDDWFAPYVITAFENKLVNGISADKFGISRSITRQDMCVMVYNAMKGLLEDGILGDKFTDDEKISEYAKAAVYSLKESGIISGRGRNEFVSQGTATRAEAAKIIYSLRDFFPDDEE